MSESYRFLGFPLFKLVFTIELSNKYEHDTERQGKLALSRRNSISANSVTFLFKPFNTKRLYAPR